MKIIYNRYYWIYFSLILKARVRETNDGYKERHHIVPRSLGGNDQETNIVVLTAKEHYICHRLLTKYVIGNGYHKMLFALDAMGMQSKNTINRYRMPARVYQYNRRKLSEIGCTEETRQKIAIANKGRKPHNTGKKRSAETCANIRDGLKERHRINPINTVSQKTRDMARLTHTGRKRSDQTRMLLSRSQIGDKNSMFGKHHTEEEKQRKREFVSNLIWINNSKIRKRVPSEQLSEYLNQNWILGRTLT